MSRVERFVFRVGDLQRADLKALRDGYLVVVALVVVAVQLAAARGVARGVGAVVVGAERPVACEDKSGSWFSQQRVVGASKCLARKRQGVSVLSLCPALRQRLLSSIAHLQRQGRPADPHFEAAGTDWHSARRQAWRTGGCSQREQQRQQRLRERGHHRRPSLVHGLPGYEYVLPDPGARKVTAVRRS